MRSTRWRRNLGAGLAAGILCAALAGFSSYRMGLYRIDRVAPLEALLVPVALLAFGSLLASLSEDILTRGYVWWQGGRNLSRVRFCCLSAALFLGDHIYVLDRGPAMWTFLLLLGLALAYALHRTGSLWLAFGAHWGWNRRPARLWCCWASWRSSARA